MSDTKPCAIAIRPERKEGIFRTRRKRKGDVYNLPLEVVEETPSEVAFDDDTIVDSSEEGLEVTGEIVDTIHVVHRLFRRQVILALGCEAVLRAVDGHVVALIRKDGISCVRSLEIGEKAYLVEVVEKAPETGSVGLKPPALSLNAKIGAVGTGEGVDRVALEFIVSSGLREIRSVGVHAVEVGRAVDESDLLISEGGESVADDLLDVVGIFAEVDGIGVPANVEVERVLS